ncbi:MAG: septation regulator SpoVG [Clostridia bacterium]|nr:septation regulator SpoVG [Clostridia bacterium]
MNITDIRIKKISGEGKMKAIVSVTFDDAFAVHDIKVIESQDRLFTAMPSRRTPEGVFKDIAHPINSETRAELERKILDKYAEIQDDMAEITE